MSYKDYYKILGISRNASDDDIKKAFRAAAKKYHPDANIEDNAVTRKRKEEVFKDAGEAYDVLSDPHKRELYDNPSQIRDTGPIPKPVKEKEYDWSQSDLGLFSAWIDAKGKRGDGEWIVKNSLGKEIWRVVKKGEEIKIDRNVSDMFPLEKRSGTVGFRNQQIPIDSFLPKTCWDTEPYLIQYGAVINTSFDFKRYYQCMEELVNATVASQNLKDSQRLQYIDEISRHTTKLDIIKDAAKIPDREKLLRFSTKSIPNGMMVEGRKYTQEITKSNPKEGGTAPIA